MKLHLLFVTKARGCFTFTFNSPPFPSIQSCAGGDRTARDRHHTLHIPLFWPLGWTLAGRQHSRVGPAEEVDHWCVALLPGPWWQGWVVKGEEEEAGVHAGSDRALVPFAGMMEFSLFGISYVSVSWIPASEPEDGVKFGRSSRVLFVPSRFRQEQISVGSFKMQNMRCVLVGCSWGPFTRSPGTTTPLGPRLDIDFSFKCFVLHEKHFLFVSFNSCCFHWRHIENHLILCSQ